MVHKGHRYTLTLLRVEHGTKMKDVVQRLLLDEGRGAGYPSLCHIDERHVGIVYEGSGSHLVFERISIDELLKQ